MSTTITGKLNKPANQFQAGESTGFSIRLGVKYRDPKTKQNEFTNYQAVIFAKAPAQIQFYNDVLVEGAVVEVTCEQLRIDSFEGNNGPMLSIDMLNARLGYVHSPNQQPAQAQQAPRQATQQPQYQQQPQQQPQYQQQPPQNLQQYNNQAPQAPQQFEDNSEISF
tara:strand:+ start:146 stop:643 length:498 start_codon:yes stop_codon:yes gene_type:complete